MAIPHAEPGAVLNVQPLGKVLANGSTTTLVKTDALEVIRIVMLAGKDIPRHAVPGEITAQCLEGNVDFYIGELKRELTTGTLLFLEGSDEHWLHANEDSSVLVTIMLTHKASTSPVT
jgi:quercetin dioxygenase-like cupin family protein